MNSWLFAGVLAVEVGCRQGNPCSPGDSCLARSCATDNDCSTVVFEVAR